MYTLDQLFTFGNWFVKLGKEEDFKKEWKEFADWSIRNKLGSNTPYLLQDITNARHFISFGPWPDVQTIKKWRQTEEFQLFVEKAKELCERFEPNTLKLVALGE